MGFFKVSDIPARRVVQYVRVSGHGENVVYIEDESVLGSPVDEMPFADKTGIPIPAAGMVFEVEYLPDAGDVYFAVQPQDSNIGDVLSVTVKAGKEPYAYSWFKDGIRVIDLSTAANKCTATQPGKYFVLVNDADGVEAVSKEAEVK